MDVCVCLRFNLCQSQVVGELQTCGQATGQDWSDTVVLTAACRRACTLQQHHGSMPYMPIGLTFSNTLVNAGLTTFDKIHSTNPRELELVCTYMYIQ